MLVGQLQKALGIAKSYELSLECMHWRVQQAQLSEKRRFECPILNLPSATPSGKLDAASASLYLDALGHLGRYKELSDFWTFLVSLPKEKFVMNTNTCTSFVEAILRMGRLQKAKAFVFGRTGVPNDDMVSKYDVELDSKLVHHFCRMAQQFNRISLSESKRWFQHKWPHLDVRKSFDSDLTTKQEKEFDRVSILTYQ